jgi:hypothetical protein
MQPKEQQKKTKYQQQKNPFPAAYVAKKKINQTTCN